MQPTTFKGKCSEFGGPDDTGVTPSEHLALYEPDDLEHAPPGLFLKRQPEGTTGTARRLNPEALYCAMRWAYFPREVDQVRWLNGERLGRNLPTCTSRGWLRYFGPMVEVSSKGRTIRCYAVDWGPNEETGRIIDLSPGAMKALGLKTDDEVTIELIHEITKRRPTPP